MGARRGLLGLERFVGGGVGGIERGGRGMLRFRMLRCMEVRFVVVEWLRWTLLALLCLLGVLSPSRGPADTSLAGCLEIATTKRSCSKGRV